MATYTTYLNLKKPEGGERYALADFNANWDKIDAAIGGKQYNIGQLTSATVADQLISFANSHKGEHGFTGVFYLSGNAVPSDLPAQTNEWKYAYGFFRIRIAPQNGTADGEVVLFGFNTNNIAIRSMANGVVSSNWEILPPKTSVESHSDWLASTEAGDSGTMLYVQKMGKMLILNLRTTGRVHTDNDTVANLPVGYRPIVTIDVPCWINGNGVGVCRIQTDGVVRTWAIPSGASSSGRVYLYAAYLTA